jgi:NAD-dependent dihydropyrimidine dehydrogenase PreA subunit
MKPIEIDVNKCKSCGTCETICPGDVIRMIDVKPKIVYGDDCWYCGSCQVECPENAIKINFPYLVR